MYHMRFSSLPLPPCLQSPEDQVSVHVDDLIMFVQLASQQDEVGENKYDLSLMAATGAVASAQRKEQDRVATQLSKVE